MAFTQTNIVITKALRNAVNRERKACKAEYYSSKVEELKGTNPEEWWREMKKTEWILQEKWF